MSKTERQENRIRWLSQFAQREGWDDVVASCSLALRQGPEGQAWDDVLSHANEEHRRVMAEAMTNERRVRS